MALKKILKGLEQSLKDEREIKPITILGNWFHNFKMRSIECRINDVKKELDNRKTKNNGSTENT
jgi:hypothetical protein